MTHSTDAYWTNMVKRHCEKWREYSRDVRDGSIPLGATGEELRALREASRARVLYLDEDPKDPAAEIISLKMGIRSGETSPSPPECVERIDLACRISIADSRTLCRTDDY